MRYFAIFLLLVLFGCKQEKGDRNFARLLEQFPVLPYNEDGLARVSFDLEGAGMLEPDTTQKYFGVQADMTMIGQLTVDQNPDHRMLVVMDGSALVMYVFDLYGTQIDAIVLDNNSFIGRDGRITIGNYAFRLENDGKIAQMGEADITSDDLEIKYGADPTLSEDGSRRLDTRDVSITRGIRNNVWEPYEGAEGWFVLDRSPVENLVLVLNDSDGANGETIKSVSKGNEVIVHSSSRGIFSIILPDKVEQMDIETGDPVFRSFDIIGGSIMLSEATHTADPDIIPDDEEFLIDSRFLASEDGVSATILTLYYSQGVIVLDVQKESDGEQESVRYTSIDGKLVKVIQYSISDRGTQDDPLIRFTENIYYFDAGGNVVSADSKDMETAISETEDMETIMENFEAMEMKRMDASKVNTSGIMKNFNQDLSRFGSSTDPFQ